MADFLQNGEITTLHNLSDRSIEEMERLLHTWGEERPMALVLPSLYSELEGPALSHIIDELSKATYIRQIIIGLDRANEQQFRHAKEFFSRLPQEHHILWNDGPRLTAVDELLKSKDLSPPEPGKGRNVWFCMGFFLASDQCESLALHDCDILTYDRGLPAKLFYPIAHPTFTYKFAKGYYFRAGEGKLNGRVTRLLVTPLLKALRQVIGPHEFIDYIGSFRYPLAGEFSMVWDVVHSIRIPSDWGLEIGVLSEAQRLYSLGRICQVDIADAYDHKHQDLSQENKKAGLAKMSTDICKAFFRKLSITGVVFDPGVLRSLKATYYRTALDLVDQYDSDADFNGLGYDRHSEEVAIELFAECLTEAGQSFLDGAKETPFLPSWNRVVSAVPDVYERLKDAVEADARD